MLHDRSLRLALLAGTALLGSSSVAQKAALEGEAYVLPPSAILDLVQAPWHTNVALTNLSPDGKRFLVPRRVQMPELAWLAKPYVNLAGVRIDPKASRARQLTTSTGTGFEIWSLEEGGKIRVPAPDGSRVGGYSWSPDGSKIGFLAHFDGATQVYLCDVATGAVRRLTRSPLNASLVTGFEWTEGGRSIVAVLLPEGRGPPPSQPAVPPQPVVLVSDASRNRLRTYRGLLETAADRALFEYLVTGQLAVIDVGSGGIRKVGKPSMIRSIDPAPGGKYFRVTTLQKPFSYIVPFSNFGDVEEIWDETGKALVELQKRPLRTGGADPATPGPGAAPGGQGAQAGPNDRRTIAWRPDGNGLSFLQQEPAPARLEPAAPPPDAHEQGFGGRRGGGAGGEQQPTGPRRRDRVMQWLPPFEKDGAKSLYTSEERIGSVSYSADCQTLFMTETTAGSETLYAVRLSEPNKRLTIFTHRTEEPNRSPGSLMTKPGAFGPSVVRMSGDNVFLAGTQYFDDPAKEGPRPFIDRVELGNTEKTRLWQSDAAAYETLGAVLADDLSRYVITRQSPKDVPNSYLAEAGIASPKRLTDNKDFAPEITQAKRERIQVTRSDGFKFWIEVTMPKYSFRGANLPALFWFYPSEYADQRAYDRTKRAYNKNLFPSLGAQAKDYFLALGYAVVEPDCPIVGPTGRMNDAYIPDLRNNLSATIDALDAGGYIDRRRLAIGGHSYGAFSSAHAMIQTPFFKAGIAGSGNYNRSLTPASFQAETRMLWEARELYVTMSPIMYAEQLQGAFLMTHGMDDQNVGTNPVNSERMFHALESIGKTAALYMYPYEDHGQAARETVLDIWARWVAWMEKYVKP